MTTAVTFQHVSRHFGQVRAVDDVSLDIAEGEFFALLGPSGSGKTTCLRLIAGFEQPSSGHIEIFGATAEGVPPYRRNVNTVFQDYALFPHMTVLENVILSAMFGGAAMSRPRATEEAKRCLEFTGLAHKADSLPDDLNLHQRKFLELARALAARPRLVLLDEVLSGMTPSEIDEAIVLIRRIRDQGATIVFVEHVMRAVMALCDRVAVLNHGKLIAVGPAKQVMSDPQVVSAYLGKPHA